MTEPIQILLTGLFAFFSLGLALSGCYAYVVYRRQQRRKG